MRFTLKKCDNKIFSEEILECTITTAMLEEYFKKGRYGISFKNCWKGYLEWEQITDLDHKLYGTGWVRMYRWSYLSNGDLYTTYIMPK